MVSSNAELQLLPTGLNAVAVRLGFAAAGDAPQLAYTHSSTACTLGAGDGGSQISSSTGGCWTAMFGEGDADLRQWGVSATAGSGAAGTNLTRINAALAYTQTAAGRCLLFPRGSVYVSGPINVTFGNACLKGADRYRSNLITTSTSTSGVVFSGAFFGGKLSQLRIAGPGYATVTAGAAVQIDGTAANVDLDDLLIEGTYDGILVNDAGVVRMNKIDVAYIKRSSYRFIGTSATDYGSQNIFLSNFTAYNHGFSTTGACIDVLAVGELHVKNGACAGHVHGYRALPATGFNVYNNYIQNVNFDVATTTGIVVDTTTGGKAQGIHFDTVTSGLSGGSGAAVNGANAKGITFSNFQAVRNLQHGINILGGDGITITGGSQILSNSVSTPGFHGVNLAGGTHISVVGSRFGGWVGEGNGNTAYNVALQNTFTGKAVISGNNLCEFGTGALFNSSTSSDVLIGRDNLCMVPSASGNLSEYGGIATIANGTNSVTFNHQFPIAPGTIIVTGTDIAHRYAATATATQITIAADTNVSGAKTVYWRGWLKQ